jgi:hypothetical protein
VTDLLVDLEVTKSGTCNIFVLDKLSVGEFDHFFKALKSILTHGIQVVLVLASSHSFDVTLNVVEGLQSLSHLSCSLVRFATVALEPHSLHFMHACLVTTSFEEDVHGVLGLVN